MRDKNYLQAKLELVETLQKMQANYESRKYLANNRNLLRHPGISLLNIRQLLIDVEKAFDLIKHMEKKEIPIEVNDLLNSAKNPFVIIFYIGAAILFTLSLNYTYNGLIKNNFQPLDETSLELIFVAVSSKLMKDAAGVHWETARAVNIKKTEVLLNVILEKFEVSLYPMYSTDHIKDQLRRVHDDLLVKETLLLGQVQPSSSIYSFFQKGRAVAMTILKEHILPRAI